MIYIFEGVGELKWAGLATSHGRQSRAEEQSESCFYSSLTKGYLGSYKKGFMLGKRYSTATSILN